MSHQNDISTLTLPVVSHRCAQETERFFQKQPNDPRYCFELFRRAFLDGSQQAWDLVYDHYRPQVASWVERHSAFPSTGEEAQDFVQRAYLKMWTALTPEKFEQFADLKSILRYLQLCVHSVIIDFVRLKEHQTLQYDDRNPDGGGETVILPAEQDALARIQSEELWGYLDGQFQNEKERRVVYGVFVLALKPRELYNSFPETFRDVNEIYRTKENVIARLRRDEALKNLWKDAQDA